MCISIFSSVRTESQRVTTPPPQRPLRPPTGAAPPPPPPADGHRPGWGRAGSSPQRSAAP
ncbi:hypothetical protein BKD26_02960 [Streptomyces sp. CB03238]|nr:hypothetical protein BKD26_02960 [Streptomyces sp. CB03238]